MNATHLLLCVASIGAHGSATLLSPKGAYYRCITGVALLRRSFGSERTRVPSMFVRCERFVAFYGVLRISDFNND